jgi:hypothetical protein
MLRVAMKVGFQNFGKEFNFAKFCEIFPLPFFEKFIGTNFA